VELLRHVIVNQPTRYCCKSSSSHWKVHWAKSRSVWHRVSSSVFS